MLWLFFGGGQAIHFNPFSGPVQRWANQLLYLATPIMYTRGIFSSKSCQDSGKILDKYLPEWRMFTQALLVSRFSFHYLPAGEDKHQSCSSSSKTPGEQSPQQGLVHRAVAFQHGARSGQTAHIHSNTWHMIICSWSLLHVLFMLILLNLNER